MASAPPREGTLLQIEIVYALPERRTVLALQVPSGTTIDEALRLSGLAERHPELALAEVPVGIWGKRAARDTALREHDRIEIYRPLIADPKAVRRARALRQKTGMVKPTRT